MNELIIILLFTYVYLFAGQYTKSQLRGMNEQTKHINAMWFFSFVDVECNHISNNVLFKAEKGEPQLRFRILCNSIPFIKHHKGSEYVNDFDNNNVLCSVLGVDGSSLTPISDGKMRISGDGNDGSPLPERVLNVLIQNKELTEKILTKLKKQFPDSNITHTQPSYSHCKEYILSW
jgi:hypothetical protein